MAHNWGAEDIMRTSVAQTSGDTGQTQLSKGTAMPRGKKKITIPIVRNNKDRCVGWQWDLSWTYFNMK